MRYLKINPKLFLVEQSVSKKAKATPAKEAINHIWIYDRSGSMSGVLPQLARDLIEKAKTIPAGDTITLGWFSGEGEYRFVLKGFKVTEARDYQLLEDTINKNKSSVGMTCFSEILADTENVVKDLEAFGNSFALCFFTDGYPNTNNPTREMERVFAAIKKIEGKVSSSLLVGYGNYYNKQLMSDMAEKLGGALIHSGDLTSFSTSLSSFIEDARENDGKMNVVLEARSPVGIGVVFGINGKQINLYSENEKGEVSFIPTKRETDSIYVLTDRVPTGATEVTLDESVLRRPTKAESLIRGAFASAYILTQRTKTDVALEVLSLLGDKSLVDSVSNAFTNTEYGQAEAKIQTAMAHPKKRFETGYVKNYLPSANAFCLLDALKILMSDSEAFFYPYHEDFHYSRIGAGSKTKDGYPEFKANKDVRCPLNNLTWNDTKLNLSILAQISGSVELSAGFQAVKLPKVYPTWVFRNYALVKDGFLNVPALPVSLSKSSFDKMVQEGVIDAGAWVQDAVYTLRLDRIPVINRSIANGKTSAKDLCKKVVQEIELEAKIKAINYLRKQIDPDGATKQMRGAVLTPDQEVFLKTQGVGKNGFSPEVEKLPTTDFYMAKEFEIKIKGLSSLPKVDEVIEKSEKGGKLNAGGLLIKKGLDLVTGDLKKSASDSAKLSLLDQHLSDLKYDLLRVRSDIQETKFAIILGKKWFDEFTSREKNTLKVGEYDISIGVDETRIEL